MLDLKTVGIICEYNPLHLGHQLQMSRIREEYGHDSTIVCLMSGNYVQRGEPAIFDKMIRAEAAVRAGADLVLELPILACLSSAEGFASCGVEILGRICDVLSFGTESLSADALFATASALLSPEFSVFLKEALLGGCSFPAARQQALLHLCSSAPVRPNDILATEYCKAILQKQLPITVFPIFRNGDYHSETLTVDAPSATSIRKAIPMGDAWKASVPDCVHDLFDNAVLHSLNEGEKAILYRVRTMSDAEFEALPYGSEGLWRRFMHACRVGRDLSEIIAMTKTKRYTRTRINRMLLCAFLGINQTDFKTSSPYVRVLAFNDVGRKILRDKSNVVSFQNAGVPSKDPYWTLEQRCADLYGLFSQEAEQPGREKQNRVFFHRSNHHV